MRKHLGIYLGHDTGVAVVDEYGDPIVILEESKFNGDKTPKFFPYFAIRELLHLGYTQFDAIGWGVEETVDCNHYHYKFFSKLNRIADCLSAYLTGLFSWDRDVFISHHMAHAYSSFIPSGFDRAIVLVIDGSGEDESLSIYHADRNDEKIFKKLYSQKTRQFSYGFLYNVITKYLGYRYGHLSEHCGKVMGLSSYGAGIYKRIFEANLNAVNHQLTWSGGYQKEFEKFIQGKFGFKRDIQDIFEEEAIEIAASTQKVLEENIIGLLVQLKSRFKGCDSLCLAGGVSLNSALNNKLLCSGLFEDVFIQPMASDSGIALGSALSCITDTERGISQKHIRGKWNDAYFGFKIRNEKQHFLDLITKFKLPVKIINEKVSASEIGKLLVDNKIIGLCRDAMEVGPRALGNRSILSAPTPEMRDKINANVKYREHWRPFAPVVMEEKIADYFTKSRSEPYMTIVYDFKQEIKKRREIEGVIHTDFTGRVQTVNRKQNEFLYDVIGNYGQHTGHYLLLNTSFNINGQPIVRTIYDAVITFLSSGIDYLVIGELLIEKNVQWDKANVSSLDRKIFELFDEHIAISIMIPWLDQQIEKTLKELCNTPTIKYNKQKSFNTVCCDSEEIKKTVEPVFQKYANELILGVNNVENCGRNEEFVLIPVNGARERESDTNYCQKLEFLFCQQMADVTMKKNKFHVLDCSDNCIYDLRFYLDVVCNTEKTVRLDAVLSGCIEGVKIDSKSANGSCSNTSININNFVTSFPNNNAEFLTILEKLVNQGARHQAFDLYKVLKSRLPEKVDPLFESKILILIGKNESARTLLEKAIEEYPSNISLLRQLLVIHCNTSSYENALEVVNHALSVVPFDYSLQLSKVSLLAKLGLKGGDKILQSILDNSTAKEAVYSEFNTLNDFLIQLVQFGFTENFKIEANSSLQKYPKHKFQVAKLFYHIGEFQRVVELCCGYPKKHPLWKKVNVLKADALAQVGRHYEKEKVGMGDKYYSDSLGLFEALIKEFPTDHDLHLKISDVYKYLRQYDLALTALQRYEMEVGSGELVHKKRQVLQKLSGKL